MSIYAKYELGIFSYFSPEQRWTMLLNQRFLPYMNQITGTFENMEDPQTAWDDFRLTARHEGYYDFHNFEYIATLANYLENRIKELVPKPQQRATVLEVGAGNGRLAHFLLQRIDNKLIWYIQSDSYKGKAKHWFPEDTFVNADYRAAVSSLKPVIVICSWMPYKEDWTAVFRSEESVQEYILIGEADGGCCGDEWLTWGSKSLSSGTLKNKIPPFEKDGFKRVDLTDERWDLLCRSDLSPFEPDHSRTVSFRRDLFRS